jgi:hypothetical protein
MSSALTGTSAGLGDTSDQARGTDSRDGQAVAGRVAIPRRISEDDEAFIVGMARTRPQSLDQPFTRWSLHKLVGYPAHNRGLHRVIVSGERLREFLHRHKITFQRAKTWKESNDPQIEAELARIEHMTSRFPDRVFALDEFGPLTIRPHLGASWTEQDHPDWLPANYRKLCGVRRFHTCYSVGDDTLFGVVRARKSAGNTLAALKLIRRAVRDRHRSTSSWRTCPPARGGRSAAGRPATRSSSVSPRRVRRGRTRSKRTLGPTHVRRGRLEPPPPFGRDRALHHYLRWRNANARHPDVLSAQRCARARVRGVRQYRWANALPARPDPNPANVSGQSNGGDVRVNRPLYRAEHGCEEYVIHASDRHPGVYRIAELCEEV